MKTLTEEQKQKISIALKLAHAEGRHPGWSFINSNPDRISYPQRYIRDILISNGLFDKYDIQINFPIKRFFLDFAVVDLKLDIEVDGQFHFRDSVVIERDGIRNGILENLGWKIYRICWVSFLKDINGNVASLLDYINDIENKSSHFYVISEIKLKSIPIYKNREDYTFHRREALKLKYQSKIEEVRNSKIDFTKFGWVKKVSKIIEKKPQKVVDWMKRYLPDIYEICYKRKHALVTDIYEICYKRKHALVNPLATDQVKG